MGYNQTKKISQKNIHDYYPIKKILPNKYPWIFPKKENITRQKSTIITDKLNITRQIPVDIIQQRKYFPWLLLPTKKISPDKYPWPAVFMAVSYPPGVLPYFVSYGASHIFSEFKRGKGGLRGTKIKKKKSQIFCVAVVGANAFFHLIQKRLLNI